MPQNKLPLYTVVSEDMFKAITTTNSVRKGPRQVVASSIDHTVGLKDGDTYYAQQFGNLEQAAAKFKELKTKILNGEEL